MASMVGFVVQEKAPTHNSFGDVILLSQTVFSLQFVTDSEEEKYVKIDACLLQGIHIWKPEQGCSGRNGTGYQAIPRSCDYQ
jgi:hypothetical protein